MNRQVNPTRLRPFVAGVKQHALSPETVRYKRLPGLLMRCFNVEELQLLTLDHVGLELANLIGQTAGLADQVDALLRYCEQSDRMEDLAVGVVEDRPQARDQLAG